MKRSGIRRSKRVRKVNPERAALNSEASAWRASYVQHVGYCDLCGKAKESLACHEIDQGNRAAWLMEPSGILVLCNTDVTGVGCHQVIHSRPALWTHERQLALLYHRRTGEYDLARFNELAGRLCVQEDVDVEIERLTERP